MHLRNSASRALPALQRSETHSSSTSLPWASRLFGTLFSFTSAALMLSLCCCFCLEHQYIHNANSTVCSDVDLKMLLHAFGMPWFYQYYFKGKVVNVNNSQCDLRDISAESKHCTRPCTPYDSYKPAVPSNLFTCRWVRNVSPPPHLSFQTTSKRMYFASTRMGDIQISHMALGMASYNQSPQQIVGCVR